MSPQANTVESYPSESTSSLFDLWARVYDSDLNPLLMLEEREVTSLLPPLKGCDVLDVGCGTGRWLSRLEGFRTASLSGIDSSPAMLERAQQKIRNVNLLCQDLSSKFQIGTSSKDFVLSSFVVSYLDNLQIFAQECARIIRPGGCLLISDMHPATAAERDWKRTFHIDGAGFEISVRSRSLQEIVSTFQNYGFDVQALTEPPFDLPEQTIFESTGKLADYENLMGIPAIYILKLQRRMSSSCHFSLRRNQALQLTGARFAHGPEAWLDGALKIEDGQIVSIRESNNSSTSLLDLSGYVVLPGLINAHDHLEFGLFPNLGRNSDVAPYQSSTTWAHEIHRVHSATIEQHQSIPKAVRLWWGAIRNLLCGVTTVCHHNPPHAEFELSEFPVQVISKFGWAHSLKFEANIRGKFRETPPKVPFIIHAAEGTDAESFEEIFQLDSMHLLDERTVLVHGLALTPDAVSLINRRGAAIVACPTSNIFLFSQTLSHEQFTTLHKIALGSDSPITAMGDLLDEIHYVRSEVGLHANAIYKMVTSNAAEILRLEHGAGHITESGVANIIAVRSGSKSPAATLSELNFNEIELVMRLGQVAMESQTI
jgi:cytosine/adenosine deaminase-related metal-dependent hydrolase/ubiquinone/menaquinone biosynthesis C-methylase UbiE